MAVENGILNLSGAIRLRGGTAADLESVNPVVNSRELMIETDTGKIKAGRLKYEKNGVALVTPGLYNWNELPYVCGWIADELESIENNVDKSTLHNSLRANNTITKEAALTAIASGTFKDIWIGTNIVNSLGNVGSPTYKVFDINYFCDMGLTNIPHIVVKRTTSTWISPETLASVAGFPTNGYYGFTEFREWLSDYADTIVSELGQEHILEHNEYLCDGITNGEPSSYNWYSSKCELMTGSQFFGERFYGSGYLGGYPQFSYYRLSRNYGLASSGILRDVASSDSLYQVVDGQLDTFTVAIDEEYKLKPYFCIC